MSLLQHDVSRRAGGNRRRRAASYGHCPAHRTWPASRWDEVEREYLCM